MLHADHVPLKDLSHVGVTQFQKRIDQDMSADPNKPKATTLICQALAKGGVYLASFLKDGPNEFRPPSEEPTMEGYDEDPEVKALTEQRELLKGQMLNALNAHDPSDAQNLMASVMRINQERQSMINDKHKAAMDEWLAKTKKWHDYIAICFALRRLGQMQAELFMKEVRACCKLSISPKCDLPTRQAFQNILRG